MASSGRACRIAGSSRPASAATLAGSTGRLDWLAVLAGRDQAALERALTSPRPGPWPRPPARKQGKAALFTEIRQDAE